MTKSEQKLDELNTLVDILNTAGLNRGEAQELVFETIAGEKGTATVQDIPVMQALREYQDGGAKPETMQRQLCEAFKHIPKEELDKLKTLCE